MFTEDELDVDKIREALEALPFSGLDKELEKLPSYKRVRILAELHGLEGHRAKVVRALADLADALEDEQGFSGPRGRILIKDFRVEQELTTSELIVALAKQEQAERLEANRKEKQTTEIQDAKKQFQKEVRATLNPMLWDTPSQKGKLDFSEPPDHPF